MAHPLSWHICERVDKCDGSAIPIYYFKFRSVDELCREVTNDDMFEMVDRISRIYNLGHRFRLLVDTRGVPPRLSFKTTISAWMRANQENARLYLDRTGVAVHSGVVRGILGVVFTMTPPTTPVKLFSTLRDASNFVLAAAPAAATQG